MNSLFFLPVSLLLGILLGNFYFRGLWTTVRKLPTTQNPILLTLGSFFGRSLIAIAGFAFVLAIAQENAAWHLLVCLGAFIWVRNRIIETHVLHFKMPYFNTSTNLTKNW
ncbi:ATP synthase subunit I [Brunnivagina elsteri]|uniref:ATP synthase subunit I n=1 Tax=Brunnivagina elsteri CCALA 953 TaxID=987040 RepID=A0A2A2TDR9_9CYAN|nr:ATP synthase subunit I [Calothrix elsteri]PAX51947.1 ATP synthase subunit I [Calothrix elsteri CCALA 953]